VIMTFIEKKQKGFTLIEVMVAIAILTLSVGGSYMLLRYVWNSASYNQSRLIAVYLAQEGIELVRNLRDNYWAGPTPCHELADGLYDDCLLPGDWEIQYDDTRDSFYNRGIFVAPGKNLYINGLGYYGYNGGTKTNFRRKINLNYVQDNIAGGATTYYLEVKSTVYWTIRGNEYNFEVKDRLYDWFGGWLY